MSRIDDLLSEHCPNGVEIKPLGEIGELIRGRRFTKADYVAEGLRAIHYGEIYTDYGTTATSTTSKVREELKSSLRFARHGDLIIAATGENLRDVCKAVAWLGSDEVAIHDDCYIFRHGLDPVYVAYYFQSRMFQDQKAAFASESKVVRISGANLARIQMPVPPLPVQLGIVSILTRMEALEADLEAELAKELEARRSQYAHYRDALLSFDSLSLSLSTSHVRWLTVGDLGVVFGGLTGKSKQDFVDGNARYVSYLNVFRNPAVDTAAPDFVSVRDGEQQRRLHAGDILLTGSSESADEVAMSSVVVEEPDGPLYLNSFCMALRPHAEVGLNPDFSKHLFRSTPMRRELIRTASGVTRFNVSKERLRKVRVPIPDAKSQTRIAVVLDRFDALTSDLSRGLLAELDARRQQYAHYRDRLFDFSRLVA